MPLTDDERQDVKDQIRDIIRRSAITGQYDSPETAAALLVLVVCRELGVPQEDVPAVLRRGLQRWGGEPSQ
ncbi:hypothetical protein ACFQU7_37070 [Pseudoroseomonas wenyumeiae]